MMVMPSGKIVVSELAGNKAVVKAVDVTTDQTGVLRSLGFASENGVYVRTVTGHPDRAMLIKELRSADALFGGGPDWSPSELVEYYREQGLVSGPYQRIVWKSPEQYVISAN